MQETRRRHPNVVNLAELPPGSFEKGTRFALANRVLGRATGARGIGCSWYEVPPGKTAFPNHYHCANEESIYVLDGTGTLRIGADEVQVGPGDYATFPVGPAHTHQLLNTGESPLRYLCFSTLLPTEVVGYPDSRKIGAMGFTAAGESIVRLVVRQESAVDYYDGEL
ncbi:MAG: cupin domain-containing protein [Gammaproteobacteria bacterium]